MSRKKKKKEPDYIPIPARKRVILCVSGVVLFLAGYFLAPYPGIAFSIISITLIMIGLFAFLLGVAGQIINKKRSMSETVADSALTVIISKILDSFF